MCYWNWVFDGLYSDFWTMRMDKWVTSYSTQVSTNVWVKLLLLLENINAHKNSILRPSILWTLSKGPHTLWPHHQYPHSTGQKNMYGFTCIMACIELQDRGPKLYNLATSAWLSKKFQTHPLSLTVAKPSSQSQPTPCETIGMLSCSGLESFGHKSTREILA